MLCLNFNRNMPRLSTSPMVRFCFYTQFEKQTKSAVKQFFTAVEPRIAYAPNELVFVTNKDVLPALQKSNMIYQFSCYCDSRYVGCTFQWLLDKIKQHIRKSTALALLPRNSYFLPASANLPPSLIPCLLLLIQPLDFIFY